MLKRLVYWLWPQKEWGWFHIKTESEFFAVRIREIASIEYDFDEETAIIHVFFKEEAKSISGFDADMFDQLTKAMNHFK